MPEKIEVRAELFDLMFTELSNRVGKYMMQYKLDPTPENEAIVFASVHTAVPVLYILDHERVKKLSEELLVEIAQIKRDRDVK